MLQETTCVTNSQVVDIKNIGTGHQNTLHSGSGCVPPSNSPDTRYIMVGPPQPVSTCVLYKCDLIVVCYKVLRDNVGKLSEALADVKGGKDVNVMIHLGGNIHASVQSPYQGINIRQWFRYQNMNQVMGEFKPGWGIFLKSGEWTEFCKVNSCLDELVPELSETIYYMDQSDHMNQLGGIACMECNPDQDYYEYLYICILNNPDQHYYEYL